MSDTMTKFSSGFSAWSATCAAILASAALAGCDEHDHEHAAENVFTEACEHMELGPDVDVTGAGSGAEAPDVSTEHTRFDIRLGDLGDGTFGGTVAFAAPEAGLYYLMLSADVPVEVTGADGAVIPVHHEVQDPSECSLVSMAYHYELPVGTATIFVGPASTADLSLIVEHDTAPAHEH